MPYVCDLHSVGVVITRRGDAAREFLVFTRLGVPAGIAPVAGHVFDSHTGPEDAARAEALEEAGIGLGALHLPAQGWRPNRCGSLLPEGVSYPAGHYWWVYLAEVPLDTRVTPQPDEVRAPQWLPAAGLQGLAGRTALYAEGLLPEQEWREAPGLEPVWCHWLDALNVIDLDAAKRCAIADLAAQHPDDHAAHTAALR